MDMDDDRKQQEWLPEELQDEVAARLPAHALFARRLVCKRWNALPSCPSFVHLSRSCSSSSSPEQWLLRAAWPTYDGFFLLKTMSNTMSNNPSWVELSLPIFPLNLRYESACHGLLLLRSPAYSSPQRLYTFNPLLQQQQRIDCPANLMRGSALLVRGRSQSESDVRRTSDCTSDWHILALAGPGCRPVRYSAHNRSWEDCCEQPQWMTTDHWRPMEGRTWSSDMHRRRMLLLVERGGGGERGEHGAEQVQQQQQQQAVIPYSIDQRRWGEPIALPAPSPQEDEQAQLQAASAASAAQIWIVSPPGGSLLVRACGGSIRIWNVETGAEMEAAPPDVVAELLEEEDDDNKSKDPHECVAVGQRVVICKGRSSICYDPSKQQQQGNSSRSWRRLPAIVKAGVELQSTALAFYPQLGTPQFC